MEIKFPCGSKGSPDFCPDLCQYGKICNVKDKKKDVPRGLHEGTASKEESSSDEHLPEDAKIEFYY